MARPFWIGPGDTMWDNHQLACQLEMFHCHVAGQIYYSEEEYREVYPDGQLPQAEGKDWVKVGTMDKDELMKLVQGKFPSGPSGKPRVSDHTQHVHVSVKPAELKPGDLTGVDPKTGMVRKFQPGDKPAGFVTGQGLAKQDHMHIEVQTSGGVIAGSADFSGGTWQDPTEEVMRLRRLMGIDPRPH